MFLGFIIVIAISLRFVEFYEKGEIWKITEGVSKNLEQLAPKFLSMGQ